jgi:alkaline phosphatase D
MRTTRRVALAALVAASALPSGAQAATHFPFGVAAAEVTSTSALLWTRADGPGVVMLQVQGTHGLPRTLYLRPTADTDLTVQRRITGLKPGTAYRYVFRAGNYDSATGRFRTAPPSSRRATIRFALSGDADALGRYNGSHGLLNYPERVIYAWHHRWQSPCLRRKTRSAFY